MEEYTYEEAGTKYTAIVANGNCTLDASRLAGKNVGLLIVNGDAAIDAAFGGTIICSGDLTFGTKTMDFYVNTSSASELVQNASYGSVDGAEHRLSEILKDPGTIGASASSTGADIDLTDLISYRNWSKK